MGEGTATAFEKKNVPLLRNSISTLPDVVAQLCTTGEQLFCHTQHARVKVKVLAVKMNGQGDGPNMVQTVLIVFIQPVFGVLVQVNMNLPQRRGMAAREHPGYLEHNGNDDNTNDHNVEDVDPSAELDVGIDQHIEQEDPVPGGSRRRSREEDDEDEESSSKRFRWWDEFTDSDSDSCFDSDVSSTGYESEDSDEDDIVAEEEEEDPLPGATRKRKRDDEDEDDDESAKKPKQ